MQSRRSFLGLGAGATLAAVLPLPALADDGAQIVSYLWSRSLDRVIAHRKIVAEVLGPGTALAVVRRPGLWGLLDEAPGSDPEAVERLAADRDRRLRAALGGDDILAAPMPDRDYERTWHVGYGLLPSEAEARARQERVARLLGPEVGTSLVLVTEPGGWQPVYQRFGDRSGTEAVARKHAGILGRHQVPAEAIPDRYLDPRPVVPALPGVPTAGTEDLPATSQTPLRDEINAHIQRLRKQGVIAPDETTSWYVQTLHDDRTWAAINAERSLQCASMVKPYVALAFLHRVEEGRIAYGDLSRSRLEAMIGASSNSATNWAMATLGGPGAVQKILTEHYGHLLPETSITENIPKSGRTYKNRSSARDYVRFSRALWRESLPRSAELKRLMSLPGRDRLYTGAPDIPTCTQVLNKTGTTSQLCGDFGILVAQTRSGEPIPYAIVGIIEKSSSASSYSSWVAARTRVIRGVSNLTYQALKGQYDLV